MSKIVRIDDFRSYPKNEMPVYISDEAFKRITHFSDKRKLFPYFILCYISGAATASLLFLILRFF